MDCCEKFHTFGIDDDGIMELGRSTSFGMRGRDEFAQLVKNILHDELL